MTTQDDSGTHATLADSGDNPNSQDLPRGSILGRYVIIEPIGSGGMGTVYRAYDPQLNRGVALKILSVKHRDLQESERAKARLIREAQALAQLSHPNVVAVHDAGAFEDDVFIAMELVEGNTLDEWMRLEKRTVKEIVEVMLGAGLGLSAAHKAGLIHRDFKPGNVIIGEDRRVRVLDFGLARAADQEESNGDGPKGGESQELPEAVDYQEISSDASPNLLQSRLTHAGGILGTPMYMAPEQHLGLKTDERTDQFGFCVVLYEALYGNRPFAGRSLEELTREVNREQVLVPSADTDVPGWLWQVVRKGLRAIPEDRYASIDSLLDDLAKDPEELRRQKQIARRRKLLMISLVLLMTALPVGVWYGLRYRTFQLCKAAEGQFAGVWDEGSKASIQKAFLGTEKSYAQGTWDRVRQLFDKYLVDWTQMRGNVCEARIIRGTQSEELFDLRMSCLRKRIGELEALAKVFRGADAGVVQKAVQASSSLTSIGLCADEKALRASYPPPKTKEAKKKVATIREKLAELEALYKTGKYREGWELAKKIEKETAAVGYRPIQAELLYQLGKLSYATGDYKLAENTLYEAARVAGLSKDGRLVGNILSFLVFVVGYAQGRPEDGLLIGRHAEIDIELGGGDDALRARFFNNLGSVFYRQSDYHNALEYYQKALAIDEKLVGSTDLGVAMSLNNVGSTFNLQGEQQKALEYHNRALAIRQKELGIQHPDVAQSLYNIGGVHASQGDYKESLEYLRKALAIREKVLDPDHPLVASVLDSIGNVLRIQIQYQKALECYRRALSIKEKAIGAEHPEVATSLSGIGRVYFDQGMLAQALEPLKKVVRLCQKKSCDPNQYGRSLFDLARALLMTGGQKERALKLAKQAREILQKTPKAFKNRLEEVNTWLQKHEVGKLAKKAVN